MQSVHAFVQRRPLCIRVALILFPKVRLTKSFPKGPRSAIPASRKGRKDRRGMNFYIFHSFSYGVLELDILELRERDQSDGIQETGIRFTLFVCKLSRHYGSISQEGTGPLSNADKETLRYKGQDTKDVHASLLFFYQD